MTEKRLVSIITGPDTHLDHLGVLSLMLNIPLIVTEKELLEHFQAFYPAGEVYHVPLQELSLAFMAEHFDGILHSAKFWNLEIGPMLKLLFNKEMRFIFCPHGNSDKGHSLKTHAKQDISLYYGAHMRELLQKTNADLYIDKTIRSGNYRKAFYYDNKKFYDRIIEKKIKAHLFADKKTILYAPSWHDRENPTSFFSATYSIIDRLKKDYNLLIKLHPLLTSFHPAETAKVTCHYKEQKGLIFLNNFPPIYPLLELCSIYLGDFSSIGYDFLSFDRPLFFLGTPSQEMTGPLSSCGMHIHPDELEHLDQFIHRNESLCDKGFSEQRHQVYTYAFGKEKSGIKLKHELLLSLK